MSGWTGWVVGVSLLVEVPGRPALRLRHLLLDVNGTLSQQGELLPTVAPRLAALRGVVEVRLLTADTYGTAGQVAAALNVAVQRVRDGGEKAAVAWQLGADSCAAIGNGLNDAAMLRAVALGIVVLGPEGASAHTIAAADPVCPSIDTALALLADTRGLTATLRP